MKRQIIMAALAAGLLAGSVAGAGGASASAAGPGSGGSGGVVVEDGTAALGVCSSVEAVTWNVEGAFVCLGGESTDLTALRTAYAAGGMPAVEQKAAEQDAAAAAGIVGGGGGGIVAAGGPVQLTGFRNAKDSTTRWVYYGTVIYGTVRTDGTITQYGRFFTRDDVVLKGNYADFTFTADPTQGSPMRFNFYMWFDVNGPGGYWKDSTVSCTGNVYSGGKATCTNHYYLASGGGLYGGLGWFAHSKLKWWNQYSPNPSSTDGSWTLTIGHGPMDCKNRAQRCQWR